MILVLIPAYNEAEPLRGVLARIPVSLVGLPVDTVVVSDGSTDGTARAAEESGVGVIELHRNVGKTNAVRVGLEMFAPDRHAAVILMDADGQHDPADLEQLLIPVLEGSCDMVVGSRYLTDSSRGCTPWNRYVVRCGTVSVLRGMWKIHVTDPFSGYRALSRRFAQVLSLEGDRYEGELEMTFACARAGYTIQEIPIERRYPAHASKMGANRGRMIGRLSVLTGYTRVILEEIWRHRGAGRGEPKAQWQ